MPPFVSLPLEIHNEIANQLPALDAALLSLTCHAFRNRLGRTNQRLWFDKINHGIESDILAAPCKTTQRLHGRNQQLDIWRESFQQFDSRKDYWRVVTDIFTARASRGCGRCLSQLDRDFGYVDFGANDVATRRYCRSCFQELFYQTSSVLETYPELDIDDWVPQVKGRIVGTIDSPATVDLEDGFAYIRKNIARRLVEEQIGPLSKAKSQSSRFLANWMIRMTKIGESTDQSIVVIVDEYTRSFKRFHPIVDPSRLHHCIWKTLLEEQVSQHDTKNWFEAGNKNPNGISLPSDTRDIIKGIGGYLKTVEENPEMNDTCQKLASMRASEYLMRLFGAKDGEYLEFVNIYHPGFLMDHIAEWATYVMPWMKIFSDLIPSELHPSDTNDICCYWCLTKNPRNYRRHKRISERIVVISSSSIVFHLLQCHPDYLGKRPQDPIGDGWICKHQRRGIPSNPNYWNYPLEDLPEEPSDSLGYPNPMRRLTSSDLSYC